ncbi:MAG: hypothetical protein ACYSUT_10805 [Planctomycetota bacterium]|jgi:peptidoglycan/LPS O-acetylase OafA/YrhL
MNYTQKCALYGLYLAGLMLLVPLIDKVDKSLPFCLKQILVLIGVGLLIFPIYRLNKMKNKTFDEYDKQICLRASIFSALFAITVALCGYAAVLFGAESFSLTKDDLATAIYFSSIVFIFSLSTGVLFQYYRLNKTERAGI